MPLPCRPRPLREGDCIALCAPSSGVPQSRWPRLGRAIAHLQAQGFQVREGATLRRQQQQCSAPAAERAAELQALLLDPTIAAVMPPWGGERAIELLPLLDFEALAATTPKWFCGFSDLSTLQVPLCLRAGWMSLHGPNLMELGAAQLDATTSAYWAALRSAADQALVQQPSSHWQAKAPDWAATPDAGYALTEPTRWRSLNPAEPTLHVRGRLIGGCIDTLGRIAGTAFGDLRSWVQQPGIGPLLVFLENAEMSPCELLRALHSLRLHGWFEQAAGILIGRHAAPDAPAVGMLTHEGAIRSALGDLGIPVLLDMDIGHRPPQLSLIQGHWAELIGVPDAFELRHLPCL
ncbi:S66 family peptidase [Paucibacter soli]|uniref:S66 family peptidase n=1 Tax=Paucibacter soli TaxID=3133433 RepID=UPI0030A8E71D